MDKQKAYSLLNCSPDSTRDEIQKAFRRLLFRYHPDVADIPHETAHEVVSRIIEAYKTVIGIVAHKEDQVQKDVEERYRDLFGCDMAGPDSGLDLIKPFFDRFRDIVYDLSRFSSFSICLENIIGRSSNSRVGADKVIHSLALGLLMLCETRSTSLRSHSNLEYELEGVRREIIGWYTSIISAPDYFSFRMAMFKPLGRLTGRISQSIVTCHDDAYRQELIIYWYLISLVSDETCVTLWTGT